MSRTYPKSVSIWLSIGVFMIFMQIVIGGVTRLTGSGLSITKWEIVTGTLPPMNAEQWEAEFDEYKASPQYEKLNRGMSLGDFKFIYFWEYFHRLWARSMGFVFFFPFVFFAWKGWLDRKLMWQLGAVVGLAAIVASFGWIMVKSGLVDLPWVSPYKLTMHLLLGLSLYALLFWITARSWLAGTSISGNSVSLKGMGVIFALLILQLGLGGMMSGMKAGLFFPTWPDMNGYFIPPVLTDLSNWKLSAFPEYHSNPFAIAFVQFFHRLTAYALLVLINIYVFKSWAKASGIFRSSLLFIIMALVLQVTLGIVTVLLCRGQVPVLWGVLHQAGAVLLMSALMWHAALNRFDKA